MKLLLMSIRAGYGHHSTAKAIMEQFENNGFECEMLDIFDYINRHLGNSIQDGYLLSTKYLSETYGKVYGRFTKKDEPYDKHSIIGLLSALVSKKLEKYVTDFNPDLIIGTHSYAGVVMSILSSCGIVTCPTIGIVTDFTVHPFWESTLLDYYVIPDMLLSYEMCKKGIPQEKLLPMGIPIRSQFAMKTDKRQARESLMIGDKKTILVMMGSMGYGNMKKMLIEMDEYPADFQIICVCGSNKKMKADIDEYSWKKSVYTYGFVDNVDIMMDAADFIISKPGGLTTSETLAKELPMIVINPLPGQEDRNLNFLVNNGAAIMVNNTYTISEALHQLLSCQWCVDLLKESVKRLGKPNAAASLYEFAAKNLLANSTETENSLPLR
ncbi:MAG: glycosyltransferase [Oscillospiraceae bacterium]|nr:glycosyltransferase [Oscillospiraceae bacterium]